MRHARSVLGSLRKLHAMDADELWTTAKELQAPFELVKQCAQTGKLPVVNFAAGIYHDNLKMRTLRKIAFEYKSIIFSHTYKKVFSGGIATPADVSLLMQIGVDGVFVGYVNLNSCLLFRYMLLDNVLTLT